MLTIGTKIALFTGTQVLWESQLTETRRSSHKVIEAGVLWVFALRHFILATPHEIGMLAPIFRMAKLRDREMKQPALRCRANRQQSRDLTHVCELHQSPRLPTLGKRLAFLRPEPPSCLTLFKYHDVKDSANTRLKLWPLSRGDGWVGGRCGTNDKKSSKQWFSVSLYPVRTKSIFLKRLRYVYCSNGLTVPLSLTINRSKESWHSLFWREF